MSTITKEWLQSQISSIEAVGITDSNTLQAFKIALASLTAEPEYWLSVHKYQSYLKFSKADAERDVAENGGMCVVPLYAAQPAPVVPDNRAITQHFDTIALETARKILRDVNRRHEFLGGNVQLLSRIQCRIDNACRAAMFNAAPSQTQPDEFGYVLCNHGRPDPDFVFADLDSAEGTAEHMNDSDTHDLWTVEPICLASRIHGSQPVSNRDELPVIGWLRSDYNSDDKRDPNAPLFMLGRNDPSETWGVKYIPLTGNSPVIPDGYVVVPVEPTMEMLDEFDSIIDYGAEDSKEAWCRLIAAAPQQEVK